MFCSLCIVYCLSDNAVLERSRWSQIPCTLVFLYLTSTASLPPLPLFIGAWLHCEDACKSSSWQMSSTIVFNYFSLLCLSGTRKNLKNCFDPLPYTYILFTDSKHTGCLTKTAAERLLNEDPDTIRIALRTIPWELLRFHIRQTPGLLI